MWNGCFPFVTFAIAISSLSSSSRCLRGHCVGASAGDVVGSSCTCAFAHHFTQEHISPHSDTFMQAMCRSTAQDLKFIFNVFVNCILQWSPCAAQEQQLTPHAEMESCQRSSSLSAHLHKDAINSDSHSCACHCGYELPQPATGHSTALHSQINTSSTSRHGKLSAAEALLHVSSVHAASFQPTGLHAFLDHSKHSCDGDKACINRQKGAKGHNLYL